MLAAASALAVSTWVAGGGAAVAGEAAAPTTPAVAAARSGAPTPVVLGGVAAHLRVPWGVAVLPDGSALVGERGTGRVWRVTPGGRRWSIGRIPVHAEGEGGLLGFAVSRTFARDRFVYAYRTTRSGNQVVRVRWLPRRPVSAPTVLLAGIAAAAHHNGGRLLFGPGGALYASTGDALVPSRAQDRHSLNGKILRLTVTGRPVPGNPFHGRTGSPYVYSYGHRNVEGLAFDSRHRLWATEFGQDTWDELNRIRPGRNYGWPAAEGRAHHRGWTDPAVQWRTSQASPSGIAIRGDIAYIGALRGTRLWQVGLAGGRVRFVRSFLVGRYGRLRTVVNAWHGALWVTTSNRDGRASPRGGDDHVYRIGLRTG